MTHKSSTISTCAFAYPTYTYSSIPLQDQGLLVIGIPLLQFQEREVVDLKVHPLLPYFHNLSSKDLIINNYQLKIQTQHFNYGDS